MSETEIESYLTEQLKDTKYFRNIEVTHEEDYYSFALFYDLAGDYEFDSNGEVKTVIRHDFQVTDDVFQENKDKVAGLFAKHWKMEFEDLLITGGGDQIENLRPAGVEE